MCELVPQFSSSLCLPYLHLLFFWWPRSIWCHTFESSILLAQTLPRLILNFSSQIDTDCDKKWILHESIHNVRTHTNIIKYLMFGEIQSKHQSVSVLASGLPKSCCPLILSLWPFTSLLEGLHLMQHHLWDVTPGFFSSATPESGSCSLSFAAVPLDPPPFLLWGSGCHLRGFCISYNISVMFRKLLAEKHLKDRMRDSPCLPHSRWCFVISRPRLCP